MGKIILGTAQFSQNYGLYGKTKVDCDAILKQAIKNSITKVDTANAYGNAESILKNKGFDIITKGNAFQSLEIFGKINTFLIHSLENLGHFDDVIKLKAKGLIKKIGFSLYFPEDLYIINKYIDFIDVLQVPFSIFDTRFDSEFEYIKSFGIEIIARSVWLQGLICESEINRKFGKLREKHVLLRNEYPNKIDRMKYALQFVLNNRFIDGVILGFYDTKQMTEILGVGNDYSVNDNKLVVPMNWGLL